MNNFSETRPPLNPEINFFGETNFRGIRKRFGIKTNDRRRHMYLVGKTGVGKSTTLENMIYQDIQNGHGLAVIDPHGDLANKVLDFVPSRRVNDVIYFDPGDTEYPVSFNILEKVEPTQRHLVASGLIGVFKKIWAESWGPRLEYVLRNAILALLEYSGSTLLGIMRILVDKEFREGVTARLTDPVVKSFWRDEFSRYPDRFQTEAIAPIQNKVGQFLSTSLIRNIVGQVKSKINMREVMDTGKILIVNLSKGKIGEDASALIGAIIITKLQLAAMSRIDLKEEQRRDFYLYVDEFQNFTTESFASILSEARKYHLDLILSHQYIFQLEEKIRDAIFGNMGTIVCFRVGTEDAEYLVKEFEPYFSEEDLINLDQYEMYVKLMIDGKTAEPFSATNLPPVEVSEGNREKIIRLCHERYTVPRREIEEKINRWASKGEGEASSKEARYKTKCARCGKTIYVPFIPDGVRPVYCKDCLKIVRKEKANIQEHEERTK